MNAWKLRNSFTVDGATVFNEAFPLPALAAGGRYTDYIRITGDFGAYALPAAITDINADPRYPLYVERTATVEGITGAITSFGFSADGETEATHAECGAPVPLSSGTVITARLYLEFGGEEIVPTFPDNVFLRWLMGCADRPAFSVGLGRDRRRYDHPVRRDGAGIEAVPVTPVFSGNTLSFTGTFPGSFDVELLLLADGVPVLRGRSGRLCSAARMYASRPVRGKYCEADVYDLISLANVIYKGALVSGEVVRRAGAMSGVERVPLKVPGSRFFGAGGAYLGILSDSEATVLQASYGSFVPYMNMPADHAEAGVTSDGAVVVADDRLRVYYPGGGRVRFPFVRADRLAVNGTAAKIHVAALRGDVLTRYKIENGEMSVAGVHSGVTYLGCAGTKIVFGSAAAGYALGLEGQDPVVGAILQKSLTACGGTGQAGAGFLTGGGTAYDLETGLAKSGVTENFGTALLFGRDIYVRDYSAAVFTRVGTLPQGTAAVARLADCIVGTDAEGLWYSTLEEGKCAVYSDSFDGGTVNYYALIGVNINDEDGECSYGFELTFA